MIDDEGTHRARRVGVGSGRWTNREAGRRRRA